MRSCLIAVALAVWFFAVGMSHSRTVHIVGDLAEYLNNPVRLLHGELPYRDFWLLHPPGELFVPAAIYALGFGINAVLVASLAVNVLVGVAAFLVVRPLVRSDAEAALGGTIVFFAGVPYAYGQYVFFQGYFLCVLVAAACLIRHLERPERRLLLGAGLALGAGCLFKLYLTGAAAAALIFTVVVDARRRGGSWMEGAGSVALVLAGSALLPLAVSLWFVPRVPEFWHAIAIDSVSHATALRPPFGHKLPEFLRDAAPALSALKHHPWCLVPDDWLRISRFLEITTIHAVPFVAVAIWLYGRWRKIELGARNELAILFFLIWGGLTFVRAWLRGGSMPTLIQAATPLYFVLLLMARPWLTSARVPGAVGAKLGAGATALALCGLAQWSLALTAHEMADSDRPAQRVVAPYGTLELTDAREAAALQAVIAAIMEHCRDDDTVFVTAWNAPPLYALTRRRNPTYYDSLIDLTHRPSEEKQRAICTDLLARGTRLVIHRPGWRTGGGTFEERCPLIDEFLRTHFEPFRECGPYVLLRTKTESGSENTARRDPDTSERRTRGSSGSI